jgi:hypothetical protein
VPRARSDSPPRHTPFPGTSASFNAAVEWAPADRSDVRAQTASLEDLIEAGHPLAGAASRIQNAATTFLENQFAARGQSLVTSPVSSFTISFGFEHPADFSSSGVRLRAVGIWKPVEYEDSARPQVETINQDVGAEHALVPDFQALADHVLVLATSRYPQHTITEGAPA